MYDEVRVLTHSSIRIGGEQIIYIDPFNIREETHDADIILVTHEHFDHYSPEDIARVKNDSTVLVCPVSMRDKLEASGIMEEFTETVEPQDELSINDVSIKAVPAYNVDKAFHPRSSGWVGYLIGINGKTYYVMGDTDANEDVNSIKCDVLLIPCGGTYTMDTAEAAELAKKLAPKLAIPTHYGSVAGEKTCGEEFKRLLGGELEADVRMEY